MHSGEKRLNLHQPNFPRLGVAIINTVNPHCNDHSLQWIYPNLIDPNTSCRSLVSPQAWNCRWRRPCGYGLKSEPVCPAHQTRGLTRLIGPLSHHFREETAVLLRPRCLQPFGLLRKEVGVCFEQHAAFQLPSAFLTSFQTALTAQFFRWLDNQ